MPNPAPQNSPENDPFDFQDQLRLGSSPLLPAVPPVEGFDQLRIKFRIFCDLIAKNAGVPLQTPENQIELGQKARFCHGVQNTISKLWKNAAKGHIPPRRFYGGIVWETSFVVTQDKPTFFGLLEIRNIDGSSVLRAPSGLLALEKGDLALHFTSSLHGKPSSQSRCEPIIPPALALNLCKAAHYSRGDKRAPERVGFVFDGLRLGVGQHLGIPSLDSLRLVIDHVELTAVRGLLGAMHFDFRVFLAGHQNFYKISLNHNAFGFLKPARDRG